MVDVGKSGGSQRPEKSPDVDWSHMPHPIFRYEVVGVPERLQGVDVSARKRVLLICQRSYLY